MELTSITFLIVCPLVFLGALVDAIGGGGGLITLPAYILAGVPVHMSIGTNKLSSMTGTCFSTFRLCRNRFMDGKIVLPTIVASLIGSSIGAHLALMVDERVMKIVLLCVLPVAAFYVLKNKEMGQDGKQEVQGVLRYVIVTVAAFVIGGYDGFYGPGTGTFLLLVYTGLARMDVRTAAGNVKLVNLASNVSAFVTFFMNGKILFTLGLAASVFSIAGHYIGAGMVIKNGTKIVRPIILVVLAILMVKLVTELI